MHKSHRFGWLTTRHKYTKTKIIIMIKKKHKQLNIASEINADREGDFGVSTQSDGDEPSSGLFYKAQLRDAPMLHWYL